MPVLQYLTTTHFDFGAVKVLASELARLGGELRLANPSPAVKMFGAMLRPLPMAFRHASLRVQPSRKASV